MPIALFLLGPAGTGKSTVARAFVRGRIARCESWALVDKDTVGGRFGPRVLRLLGSDGLDRDSALYRREVRDDDYGTTLDVARDQLEVGTHVLMPGPWSRELASGALFDASALGLGAGTTIRAAYLHAPAEVLHARIAQRAHPRDAWKLAHWDAFAAGLPDPGSLPAGVSVLDATRSADAVLAELQRLVGPARPG